MLLLLAILVSASKYSDLDGRILKKSVAISGKGWSGASLDGTSCLPPICTFKHSGILLNASLISKGRHTFRAGFEDAIVFTSMEKGGQHRSAHFVVAKGIEQVIEDIIIEKGFTVKRYKSDLEVLADRSLHWDVMYSWKWPFHEDTKDAMKQFLRRGHKDQWYLRIPGSTLMTKKNSNCEGTRLFDFVPSCVLFPQEFEAFSKLKVNSTFLYKPSISSRGRGIRIFKDHHKVIEHYKDVKRKVDKNELPSKLRSAIVTEYIDNPLLLDGHKFDLRVYVVIVGIDPLRVYIRHNSTLVRLATEKYEKPNNDNMDRMKIHLTNSALNRGSGGAMSFTEAMGKLDKVDQSDIERQIENIVVQTISQYIKGMRYAVSFYGEQFMASTFSDVFGFDVMIDSNLKLWLLEVNFHPNLSAKQNDTLRLKLKTPLISEWFDLLSIGKSDKVSRDSKAVMLRDFVEEKGIKICSKVPKGDCFSEDELSTLMNYERELSRKGEFKLLVPSSGVIFDDMSPMDKFLQSWEVFKGNETSPIETIVFPSTTVLPLTVLVFASAFSLIIFLRVKSPYLKRE